MAQVAKRTNRMTTRVLTGHDKTRPWVEKRSGEPARVKRTGHGDDARPVVVAAKRPR